jgi:hypothetical protein
MIQRSILWCILMFVGVIIDNANGYLPVTAKKGHRQSFRPAVSSSSHPSSGMQQSRSFGGGRHRHRRLSRHVTSGQFNEEDLNDDILASVSSTSSNGKKDNQNGIQPGFILQVGMVAVLGFLAYTVATMFLTGAMDMASSASDALGDEVGREMTLLGSRVWSLLISLSIALWEILKVLVPFIGKGIIDAGKAAAPVVGEASSRFTEVATPYVNEAARVVNEAATPYVQEAARAVDESVVAPVKSAVDANIMVPIQGAQNVMSSQISAMQSSVTSQIDAAINDVGQSVSSTVQAAADQATTTLKEAIDAQTADIAAPIQDITTQVDASIKGVVKPIQDALPF